MWLVAIVLDTAGLLVYMVYTWVRVKFRHLHLPKLRRNNFFSKNDGTERYKIFQPKFGIDLYG